jgi:hypothetical protein
MERDGAESTDGQSTKGVNGKKARQCKGGKVQPKKGKGKAKKQLVMDVLAE